MAYLHRSKVPWCSSIVILIALAVLATRKSDEWEEMQAQCTGSLLQDAVSLWVQLGSAAAHDGPLLGKGARRISVPHDFTAQLLVAHQVMTEG